MPQYIIDTFSDILSVVDNFMNIPIYVGNLYFTFNGLFKLILVVFIISVFTVFLIKGGDMSE